MYAQPHHLALPSSNLPLVYRHPLQALVTSLPYVDEEVQDPRVRAQVDRLIQMEMQNMNERDYLSELPMPKTHYSQLIQSELERVSQEIPMEKTNFEGKYIVESQPETETELKNTIDLLSVREQHNQINHLNVELLHKYGAEFWKMLIQQQGSEKDRLQNQLDRVKYEMNEVNALRKYEQLGTKQKVDQFKYKIGDLKVANEALELECLMLEESNRLTQKKKMKLID